MGAAFVHEVVADLEKGLQDDFEVDGEVFLGNEALVIFVSKFEQQGEIASSEFFEASPLS